jgi:hypothetical protein
MSDSDYKYRRAWREAYDGALEAKTCPKKPVGAAVAECSKTTTPLNKADWQKKSLEAAGIDESKWNPKAGFEANRENVKKVYAYYTSLYNQNSDLKWAGMAKLAGGTVYGGLETGLKAKRAAAVGSEALPLPLRPLGGIAQGQAQYVENKMVGMQKDIFMDLGWQHQAYVERGICELEAAYSRGEISKKNIEAWRDIASGDEARVWRGNKALLRQEQFDVLDPSYKEIRGGLFGGPTSGVISKMSRSPIPGGKPFSEVVPGGDVTDFNDRWKWIEDDMLPKYQQLTPAECSTLVNQPLEDLADGKFAVAPGAPATP